MEILYSNEEEAFVKLSREEWNVARSALRRYKGLFSDIEEDIREGSKSSVEVARTYTEHVESKRLAREMSNEMCDIF